MSVKTGSQAAAADVFSPGSASSPGMTALQLTRSPYSASALLRTLLVSAVVLLVGLLRVA